MKLEEKFKLINECIERSDYLSDRAYNIIHRANLNAEKIYTIGYIGLLKIRGLGHKTIKEIVDLFRDYGIIIDERGPVYETDVIISEAEREFNIYEKYDKLKKDYDELKRKYDTIINRLESIFQQSEKVKKLLDK